MKKIKLILGLLIFTLVFSFSSLSAQSPPPPPPGGSGDGDTEIGGDAPAGGGIFLLASFVLAYAGRKAYSARKKLEEQE